MSGTFVAIEGPNGVGKTTATTLLTARLRERHDTLVHQTTEPSDTPLGRLLRSSEAVLTGRALALAIAADRYAHIENEIKPRLEAGCHVISDRYVPSSLVLQRLDGLTLDEIWGYNAYVLAPTITFYLEDNPRVIRRRLETRQKLSRLEQAGSPERELVLYAEARDFLRGRGWTQEAIDCTGMTPERLVAAILDRLDTDTT